MSKQCKFILLTTLFCIALFCGCDGYMYEDIRLIDHPVYTYRPVPPTPRAVLPYHYPKYQSHRPTRPNTRTFKRH